VVIVAGIERLSPVPLRDLFRRPIHHPEAARTKDL